MNLHLGGYLNWYDSQRRTWIKTPVSGQEPLAEVVSRLGIPTGEIIVVLVNGVTADLTATVRDADRVELYPALGGG